MKKMKRVLIFVLIMSAILINYNVFAVSSYIEEARILYDLGVYKGVSPNHFESDLDTFLDRETSIVFLLRLLGQKDNTQYMSEYQVSNILNEYTDQGAISDWARKYMAYGISENIFPDISENVVFPKRFIDGKTFTAMLLKCMGYTLDNDMWKISSYINCYLGGISAEEAKYLNEKILTKNDMIGIVWKTFNINNKNGTLFLQTVMSSNNIDANRLSNLGFHYVNGIIKPPVFNNVDITVYYDKNEKYFMQDGSAYYGENIYGVPHGTGVVEYADGSRYEGHVSNGQRDGEGKLIRNDGFVYSGGWKNDKMYGYGMLKWPNGDSYTGEIKDGIFDGKGTMIWFSGDSFSGQWVNGQFSGYGRFEWISGNYYDGHWDYGEFNGYGTFFMVNVGIYEGDWQNGKKNGRGKFVYVDNTILSGLWENDAFVRE